MQEQANRNKFDKETSRIAASLWAEIERVNPLYLMGMLNQQIVCSVNFDKSTDKLPDGFAQKFHYICGLLASRPLPNPELERREQGGFDRILKITDKLFHEYVAFWMMRPGSEDEKKHRERGVGLSAFMIPLFEPKLGSTEQFIRFTLEQFEPFDERFFIPQIGVTARQCVDISKAILERVSAQHTAFFNDTAELMSPFHEAIELYLDGKLTLEESRARVKDVQPQKFSKRYKDNELKFITSFVVSKEDLSEDFPASDLDAYFESFSFEPGAINKNFRLPTDFNELDLTPLMRLEEGKYYVTEAPRLLPTLSTSLLHRIANSSVAQRYFIHRDRLTHHKSVQLLGKVFPPEHIVTEAYYGGSRNMDYETDILIPHGRTLLICEVKAKALRNPLHTEGNLQKIRSDFNKSIQEAYTQAVRTRNFIQAQESALFLRRNRQHLCTLKRNDFDEYLLMVVTAESFGNLATDLSALLEKEENDPYPLAISLFDLELLVTRLNTAEKFLDYIRQRRQLHGLVYGGDELDFAGYYLKYGNLDLLEHLRGRKGMIMLSGDFSRIFDEDWYKGHGFEVGDNGKAGGPYIAVTERKGNDITVGVRGEPKSFKTFRLGGVEKNSVPMKGRERNALCPCGSEKKFKKCCGE
jgi:hypothetical protein